MLKKQNAQPRNAELSARKNSANPTTDFSSAPLHDQAPVTMAGREIAELCEKHHGHVMVDCRKSADFCAETYSPEKSGQFAELLAQQYGAKPVEEGAQ